MLETKNTSSSFEQQLASLSPSQRALLELRLMQKSKRSRPERETIKRQTGRDSAPLSYHQQGLWVLDRLMPGTAVYHSPTAARLYGELDVPMLTKALQEIVARHDGLRTSFKTIDGSPVQVINDFVLEVPLVDLRAEPDSEREEKARHILRREARTPFDLSQGPLIRAIVVRMDDQDHILLVTMHHIVTDGWSVGIFHRELSELYRAFRSGRPSPFPELSIQYLDYSVWQREWLDGDLYQSQLAFWKEQFRTLPPALELPVDHARPTNQAHRAFKGAHHTLCLSSALTKKIRQACQTEGVTLFMMLMAAYQILLHRYTGEEDIVVGTPIAGRQQPETEALIGLFINTLAMRGNLAGNPTAHEFLQRTKQVALGAYAHQDLPFERLVKEIQPERTAAHNPLFQVMFVLQSEEILPLQLTGLKAEHFRIDNVMANFDLTLDVVEKDDQLECLFESNADLFESETIERMMRHFEMLLNGIADNPGCRISELPLLTEAERHQLLIEWNNTATDYPSTQTIHELFAQQVEVTPDAVALVWGNQQIAYDELNARANQLAHYLQSRGVRPDTRVAVCMRRSPELLVSILAILKAGGAYVPLDPDYPPTRLGFMLKDAQAALMLTQRELITQLPTDAEIICVNEITTELTQQSRQNPLSVAAADNLAYVMYTSGSTGTPKGVAVTHRNVIRLVKNTNYASFSVDEVFLQASTVSFDASTFEIWGSLLNGARLVLLPAGAASLNELAHAIKQHGVTTVWLTAGLFHLMVENHLEDLRSVRQLLAGGDVLSVPHVQKVFRELKDCRLINGYGPTENTTFTCCYPIHDLSKVNGSVPIGFPISNTSVYILDRSGSPVPVGVPGELYIGGDGLARGYLDRPALTSERFVRNPFSNTNDRLYRTGDLVRYKPSGEIEFIGRIDNQVKVRGYRIELGEIEAALLDHPGVREAVVVARKDRGDKHLAAYMVPRNGHLSDQEVREFIQHRLPDYMVPSVFVTLKELPLSPVGKVDRRALPAPNELPRETSGFVAAESEIELKLTRIWERVLNVQPIGTDENFFDLGGHSLLAVRLFAEIEKNFGKNLPLATLFQAPTIKQLARALCDEGWQPSWSSLVMIQAGGSRPPFFCVHAAGGNVLEYHELARLLGPDQPFYGFQAQGLDGKQPPHTSIKEMAAHYIREMREVQPEGPYLLGGRSSGGTIAFEMACQLNAAGEAVALLALLDTFPAGYFKLLPGASTFGQRCVRRAKKWQSHFINLRQLNASSKIDYVVNKLRYVPAKTRHRVYRRAYKIYQKFGRPLPPVLRNIEEINFTAVKDYQPQIYSGDVKLFLATDLTADYDSESGWRELVRGRIDTCQIPGNHLDIIKEPGVRLLAEKLRSFIAESL
jgi:amino acid adenylation domain-containing protein